MAAVAAALIVARTYFYARHLVQNALKQVPQKLGLASSAAPRLYPFSVRPGTNHLRGARSKGWFQTAGEVDFDPKLFAIPESVKIEESKP